MENLTTQTFKEKIFNYDKSKDWKFEGTKPTIIEFGAEWCGPCRMMVPILEELNEEYKEKIDFFKVDVDENSEISSTFGIKNIPAILFIPINVEPEMSIGAMSKTNFIKTIKEILKVD